MIWPMAGVGARPVLALDASEATASACVLMADGTALLEVAEAGQRAGTVLHSLAHEALRRAGCHARDLERIAVVRGPGSFTGIRVGLATAMGLSLASGVPAVGLDTPRVAAFAAHAAGAVTVLLDAGQGRLSWTACLVTAEDCGIVDGPSDITVAESLARLAAAPRGLVLHRGDAPCAAELLAIGVRHDVSPLAEAAARLARGPAAADSLLAAYGRAPAIRSGPSA